MQPEITPKEVAAKLHEKLGGAPATSYQIVAKAIREGRLKAKNISAANRPIYLVSSMDANDYVSGFVKPPRKNARKK